MKLYFWTVFILINLSIAIAYCTNQPVRKYTINRYNLTHEPEGFLLRNLIDYSDVCRFNDDTLTINRINIKKISWPKGQIEIKFERLEPVFRNSIRSEGDIVPACDRDGTTQF